MSFVAAGASLLLLGGAWAARAADYLIDVWDSEDHLPNSSVTAIAQTPDGYLWVGTYNGLARFDGLHFQTFDPVDTPALGHARIQDLFLDTRGTLWINTYRGGLTSYRNGVFRREWEGSEYDLHTSLGFSSSNAVVFVGQFGTVFQRQPAAVEVKGEWQTFLPPARARLKFYGADAQGTLWFLSREGRIVRWSQGHFQELPPDCGLASAEVKTLAADARGTIWAGTKQELARWDGRRFQDMTPTNGEAVLSPSYILPVRDGGVWVLADGRLRKAVGRRWTLEPKEWQGLLGWASGRSMGMHEDREGGIWFNHYGNGLFHVTAEGQFQRFTAQDGLPGDRLWTWFEGREGNLWVGVDRGGLVRLRPRRFQVVGQGEGLPARAALSVCEDPSGAQWFGTSGGGLCRWRDGQAEPFAVGTDASANFVFSVFPRPEGGLWLSAGAGEEWFQFQDGKVTPAPWEVHAVKCQLVDRAGRVWLGTKSGLVWWTPGQRHTFSASEGMVSAAVRALTQTPDGNVWCGADDGTLFRCETNRVQAFRPSDARSAQPIWSLLADGQGAIWAGTSRGGLLRFKGGKFARLTTEQGLPDDVISQVLEDRQGNLWLGTHAGICRVAKTALEACADGRQRYVDCVTYGRQDGLPSLECAGNYQPSCWRGHDGRLWFATVKGMVSVKPEDLKANPVPPPVAIEDFRVDGERLPLGAGQCVVPPGRKQFEFRFTGLSFLAPENVRFRYRLEGLEKEWVEAGTRRSAQYSHLRAGDYRFCVLACNNDGVWNQTGSWLAFTVKPYFYETWWFLSLAGVGVVGGVAGTVRGVTTRKYRRELARLEQQHAIERDRARIAKDIHDDLGAGLTQITLLSELARREPPGHAGTHLDRICDSARQMTRAMDEIVWAVDPQHDTLNALMDYISAFTEDFLRTAGIRCRMDLPADLPALRVDAETRYNLFLAIKETLNNIVKHSRATEVWLRLRLHGEGFTLLIEDNGQGLPSAEANGRPAPGQGAAALEGGRMSGGHGLPNLEKRLAAIGGRCTFQSAPGQGTRVEMSVCTGSVTSPIVAMGSERVSK